MPEPCSDTLCRLGAELKTLAGSTEGEFLSMGENLLHFHRRASEILKISQSVVHSMSGEKITTVVYGFHRVVACMERLEGDSRHNISTLQRVMEILDDLFPRLTGFNQTVRGLRVLCVLMKIESARLGESEHGFDDLAEEIAKLALEIEEKCSHLLGRSEALGHLIGQAQTRVREIEVGLHAQAKVILDRTMASIETITERNAARLFRSKRHFDPL